MFVQVGDDEFGYMLVDVLRENEVETRGCRFDANARTALAFVTLRHDGEREFMFYRNPSADMLFEPEELDTELLREVFDPSSHRLLEQPICTASLCCLALSVQTSTFLQMFSMGFLAHKHFIWYYGKRLGTLGRTACVVPSV
jgi:fructokinase